MRYIFSGSTLLLPLLLMWAFSECAMADEKVDGLKKLSEYLQAEVEYIDSTNPILRIGKVRQFGPAIDIKLPTGAEISSFTRVETTGKFDKTGVPEVVKTTIGVDEILRRHEEWGSLSGGSSFVSAQWKCCPSAKVPSSADNTDHYLHLPRGPSKGLGEFIVFPGAIDPSEAQKQAYLAVLNTLVGATFAAAPRGEDWWQAQAARVVSLKPGGSFDLAGIKEGDILYGVGASQISPFERPREAVSIALSSLDGSRSFEILRGSSPRPLIVNIVMPGTPAETAYVQPDNPKAVSSRLAMFEKGEFDLLEKALQFDVAFLRNAGLNILWVLGAGRQMEAAGRQSRYSGLMAQYIHMKQHVLGDCGKPQVPYRLTTTVISALRTASGLEFNRREDVSARYLTVQADFAEIVEFSKTYETHAYFWSQLFEELKNESCDSLRLKAIEQNMIKFFDAR